MPNTYAWRRYWVKQGESPSVEGGFFVEPSEPSHWAKPRSNGLEFAELSQIECLILLGDVGMGKSYCLKDEAEKLRHQCSDQTQEVLCVDLKRLTESQIENQVFQSAEMRRWEDGLCVLHVFLDSMDECWRRFPALEEYVVDGAAQPAAARDILELMHRFGNPNDFLDQIATANSSEESIFRPVAAAVLLGNDPVKRADSQFTEFEDCPEFGRTVIPHLIRGATSTTDWLDKLSPHQLARFWEWLNENFPGDPYEEGSGNITIAHDIYHFRNAVFNTLAKQTSLAACDAMNRLLERKPDEFWLGEVLAKMRRQACRASWVAPKPINLLKLFADSDARLIRSEGELHALVVESIRRFENHLHKTPPSQALWSDTKHDGQRHWKPKDD